MRRPTPVDEARNVTTTSRACRAPRSPTCWRSCATASPPSASSCPSTSRRCGSAPGWAVTATATRSSRAPDHARGALAPGRPRHPGAPRQGGRGCAATCPSATASAPSPPSWRPAPRSCSRRCPRWSPRYRRLNVQEPYRLSSPACTCALGLTEERVSSGAPHSRGPRLRRRRRAPRRPGAPALLRAGPPGPLWRPGGGAAGRARWPRRG